MSIKALQWARSQRVGSSTRKQLLMSLADRANEERGWASFVGQATLAEECELSERSVRRVLAQLERIGVIRRERRHRKDGTRSSDVTFLVPDWPGLPDTQSASEDRLPDTLSPDTVSGSARDLPDTVSRPTGHCVPTYRTESPDLPDTVSGQEQEDDSKSDGKSDGSDVAEATPDLTHARRLAEALADSIAERGFKRPTVTKAWIRDMDRLLRLDGREPSAVGSVIRWLTNTPDDVASFWAPNIRSPAKLRAKWDQMQDQYTRIRNGSSRAKRTEQAWADSQAIRDAIARGDIDPDTNPLDSLTGGSP